MHQEFILKKANNREAYPFCFPEARDASAGLKAYFQEKYPIMLDGALIDNSDTGRLLREARASLAAGKVDPEQLPASILRETLESISASPAPSTQAGLTPIGPESARIWWARDILDNLGDVLSQLDKPRAVLRFYDITDLHPDAGRWHSSFDIDVSIEAAGRTVPLWADDREYFVDLGYIYADGRFLRLARTNAVRLPRRGPAQTATPATDAAGTVTSTLRRQKGRDKSIQPDQAARDWAAARPDFPDRDLEAELTIHMLYRAFLQEGLRALRRSPRLIRRDKEILRKEFSQRSSRIRHQKPVVKTTDSVVMVARLDDAGLNNHNGSTPHLRYQPVLASVPVTATKPDSARFMWLEQVLAAARTAQTTDVAAAMNQPVQHLANSTPQIQSAPSGDLVRALEASESPLSLSLRANPVFAAAEDLRSKLAAMDPVTAEPVEADIVESPRAETTVSVFDEDMDSTPERHTTNNVAAVFGGVEAKRMAKAGVRFTRMALTLEGRMRPGARLKVAGRLVQADSHGHFRLECVLTGKRASIPMRAGTSVGGEARSLINIDWGKREGNDKRRVYQ